MEELDPQDIYISGDASSQLAARTAMDIGTFKMRLSRPDRSCNTDTDKKEWISDALSIYLLESYTEKLAQEQALGLQDLYTVIQEVGKEFNISGIIDSIETHLNPAMHADPALSLAIDNNFLSVHKRIGENVEDYFARAYAAENSNVASYFKLIYDEALGSHNKPNAESGDAPDRYFRAACVKFLETADLYDQKVPPLFKHYAEAEVLAAKIVLLREAAFFLNIQGVGEVFDGIRRKGVETYNLLPRPLADDSDGIPGFVGFENRIQHALRDKIGFPKKLTLDQHINDKLAEVSNKDRIYKLFRERH